MKKADYVIERGIEKLQFKRGVEINEKFANLTVELNLNWKKGIYKVAALWNFEQITGNNKQDKTTLQTINDLMLEARDYAIEWQTKWKEDHPSDPDQMEMGFGDPDIEGDAGGDPSEN